MADYQASLDLEKRQNDFLFEEYKALRSEIELLSNMSFGVERNCAAAIMLIYGLIFTEEVLQFSALIVWIWFLPPLFSIFCLVRVGNIRSKVFQIGAYIGNNIEPMLAPDGAGWEAFQGLKTPPSVLVNGTRRDVVLEPGWNPSKVWLVASIIMLLAAIGKFSGHY